MNRRLLVFTATVFAFCSTLSCSDKSTSDITGLALNDSAAAESRIASATVTLAQSSLEVGRTTQATALLLDRYNRPLSLRVSWSTSDTSLAVVSASGLVSAKSPGAVSITATRANKSGSATLTVIPSTVPVASVSVNLAAGSLNVGQTTKATATLRDSNNTVLTGVAVAWTSSNVSAATVSDSGAVTALAAGSALITASSEGQSGTATLSVAAAAPVPVASVSVSPSTASLQVGATVQLMVTARDANDSVLTGRIVTSSSADPAIASINSLGLVTAVSPGTTQITVTSEGKSAIATITVSAPAPVSVASVSVSPTAPSLLIGAAVQLAATTRDANNNILTGRVVGWSSANAGIASVSSTGRVTAVSAGTTQITASSEGMTGSATVTVTAPAPVPVASVSVSPAAPSLLTGATVQLSATTRDASNNVLTGRVVTWSSANAGIASVSPSGLVTAISAGTIQVTATSESKTGSATITVTAPPPPPPPPPGSSNEPTGMTLIDQRPFNSIAEHAAPYSPAWDTDNSLSIVQDATAPISPSNVIRATYPAGFHSGSAPGHAGVPFPGVKTLYVRFAAKLSLNWQGEDSGFCKYFYAWINGSGDFFFASNGIGSSPLQPYSMLQSVVVFPSGNGNWGPNLVPSARIIRGQWQTYEFVLVGNSAGTADGSVDSYLDGVHIGHVGGIQWTAGDGKWDTFEFRPIWGGTGATLVQQTQTMDWDNVYLSGKN